MTCVCIYEVKHRPHSARAGAESSQCQLHPVINPPALWVWVSESALAGSPHGPERTGGRGQVLGRHVWGRAATARRGQPAGTCARVPWVAQGGWGRASCSGGRWYRGQTQRHAWKRSQEPSFCLRSCHGRPSPLMDICHGHPLSPQDHPSHPMAALFSS